MAVQVHEFICEGCAENTASFLPNLRFCDECHDARVRCAWCDQYELAEAAIDTEPGAPICRECADRSGYLQKMRAVRQRDAGEDQRDAEADDRRLKVAS